MKRRPNFIVLMGEDTGLHLGCYGDACARTPFLDRLAAKGVRFTNAISTAPVCSPSRCSLITGQYPWAIGTHHHRSTLLKLPRLFTQDLRDAGYYVNWSNKTDFNFTPSSDFTDPPGDWLKDLASGRLPDQPFLLYANFGVTHESTMWRIDPSHAACIERVRAAETLGIRHRYAPDAVPVPAYLADEPEIRGDIARYFDALAIQDAQVGAVLQALEKSPYRDRTYVIYLSDHGRGLLREKRWCYEAGIHLPLLITGPDLRSGEICDTLVNWTDLAPTILSLAGLSTASLYPGHIFLGEDLSPERTYAFAGRGRMDETYDSVRAVRDKDFLYLYNDHPQMPYAQPNSYEHRQLTTQTMHELYAQGRLGGHAGVWFTPCKPREELYAVRSDSDNVCNLADDLQYKYHLERLRAALSSHRRETGDLGLLPERELIERGLVADVLQEMDQRRKPLHELYAVGGYRVCALEMPQ